MTWRSLTRIISGIRGAYNDINPSTLTGAIDVLVIENENGTYNCGPFYVRFGKLTAISPTDKIVEIYVNGRYVDFIRMRLDPAGNAYFVYDEHLSSSDQDNTMPFNPTLFLSPPGNRFRRRIRKVRHDSAMSEPDASTDMASEVSRITVYSDCEQNDGSPILTSHFVSDSAIDEHLKVRQDFEWNWQKLQDIHQQLYPTKRTSSLQHENCVTNEDSSLDNDRSEMKPYSDGVYLEDLVASEADKHLKETYIYAPSRTGVSTCRTSRFMSKSSADGSGVDAGYRSDGEHTPRSLSPICSSIFGLRMSLCGCPPTGTHVEEEEFLRHLVIYEEFIKDPDAILANPNLTILLNGKYYNWPVAAPAILSILSFQTELPQRTIRRLASVHMSKKKSRTSWFSWGAKEENAANLLESEEQNDNSNCHQPCTNLVSMVYEDADKDRKMLKSNRLTSEEVVQLNLTPGRNDVEFRVITKFQGTCICSASIFLWRWSDRIIVSDVDGTITRSDVLGHLLPMFGRDWTHAGVARLYDRVSRNGYKFIYLSARAIGQAEITRSYLRHVTQENNLTLPDGPILLSPSSLFHALHQEVIEKKPELFKIRCLADVCALFPQNPLFAGFGNKENDVCAYRKAGILDCRIFTINPRGEVHNEFHPIKSTSYSDLSDLVDHYFPVTVQRSLVLDSNNPDHRTTSISVPDHWKTTVEAFGATRMQPVHASTATPDVNDTQPFYVDMSKYSSFTYWRVDSGAAFCDANLLNDQADKPPDKDSS